MIVIRGLIFHPRALIACIRGVVFILFCLYGLINKVVMRVDTFNDLDSVIMCQSFCSYVAPCM